MAMGRANASSTTSVMKMSSQRRRAERTAIGRSFQAIRWLVGEWAEATAAGDVERLRPLMTADVVFLASSSPEPMCGREAFLQVFAEMIQTIQIGVVSDIREIQISGDLAYCWNYLVVTVRPRSGGQGVVRKGHVLSVLRRTSGGWAIERDANLLATES